jgi:hypothetical protein
VKQVLARINRVPDSVLMNLIELYERVYESFT